MSSSSGTESRRLSYPLLKHPTLHSLFYAYFASVLFKLPLARYRLKLMPVLYLSGPSVLPVTSLYFLPVAPATHHNFKAL